MCIMRISDTMQATQKTPSGFLLKTLTSFIILQYVVMWVLKDSKAS